MSGKQLKLKAVKQEGVSTNEFCRLCLAKCNGANLLDIFDSTTDTTISSRILLCTGLQVIKLRSKMCLHLFNSI